ncbi:MAG: ice-binding family protein, partial [Verrucomicrobiota bacterium]
GGILFSDGLDADIAVFGSRFDRMTSPFINVGSDAVVEIGGNNSSVANEVIPVELSKANTVVEKGTNSNRLIIKLLSTGLVKGKFISPVTGKSTVLQGAMVQNANAAFGFFVTSGTRGFFELRSSTNTVAQGTVPLGAVADFAVLAGSTVANTGTTQVTGDLGVSPGTAITGFPPGTVTGAIHANDTAAAQAQTDLTTAFNDAAGRTVGAISKSGNLGGQTLAPGLYKSTSSLSISSGDLTLDAQGNSDAVWIFQIASTLTTSAGRQVILSGGAKASNVFWQVGSSATLGTTTVFKGTIMADQSITLNTGATLDGRALARIAAVTLDGNTVTIPAP